LGDCIEILAGQYENWVTPGAILLSVPLALMGRDLALGLLGLSTFMAQQRVKGIGVRKVLGSSVSGIVLLLSKDFIKLVLIAIVIAVPLCSWAMNRWLQDFAFRISIGWTVFVIAGTAAILISLITVGFQAIKAAIANPVKSLRTE
jgi:putative ABC transport system permease protein